MSRDRVREACGKPSACTRAQVRIIEINLHESSVALNNCTLRMRFRLQADDGGDTLHRHHEMRACGVYPEQFAGIGRLEEGVLQLEG